MDQEWILLKERLMTTALDELNNNPDRLRQQSYFTIAQIRAIGEMALNDVYPDWHFSDDECNLWEIFRSVITRTESKESD